MDATKRLNEVSLETANSLKNLAHSGRIRSLSRLSLPEVDAVVNLVAQIAPAGNVPGIVLSGLARLAGRRVPADAVRRDVNLLFKGVRQVLDGAVYGAFFAGPAAVIWAYQNLLRLAGKDPEDAFPEGTWQFYVEYALREDTARHATETRGFDSLLQQHHIRLSPADRLTAWVMAAIHILHQYDDLLENEWRERVYTTILREVTKREPDAAHYTHLYREWEKLRPFGRGPDAGVDETYPAYRRNKFDSFLEQALSGLREDLRRAWVKRVNTAKAESLPAYQRQMSILAYLDPGVYGETRTSIRLAQAHVGVVCQGCYFLIPACAPHSEQPAEVGTVRRQVAALVANAANLPPAHLAALATVKREELPALRKKLSAPLLESLQTLRLAPIIIDCDPRPPQLILAELRQTERGIGDHALTVFDTGQTFVFDLSHIFFDGMWGAALAEIMTNEALAWAVHLHRQPPPIGGVSAATCPRPLVFNFKAGDLELIQQVPRVALEAGAETDAVNLRAISGLRRLFKRRNDLIDLTINDLLVLYRAIHAAVYRLNDSLAREIEALKSTPAGQTAALAVEESLRTSASGNPAILIPVDASRYSPRDRLYPMNFEVPLLDLDLIELHEQVLDALQVYRAGGGNRAALYAEFDRSQRTYLAVLAGFGQLSRRAREIASLGESSSVGTLKLLAHLPAPLQRLMDKIPDRFDILNDLIRGREVFSNMGAVPKSSTLTRFMTAKDDNDKKSLAWGVITDADGSMHISLRDFRPHVARLVAIGQKKLAVRLAEDYLAQYAQGLNMYIRDLRQITLASRDTRTSGAKGDVGADR